METITIKVKGMTCGGCVASVERVLRDLEGVGNVSVSLADEEAKVEFDRGRIKPEALRSAIEDAGFDAA